MRKDYLLFVSLALVLACAPAYAKMTKAQVGQLVLVAIGDDPPAQDAEAQLRTAAANGDPWGEEGLGISLAVNAIAKNQTHYFQEAVEWFRKAAASGLPEGAMSLAKAYMDGEGVKQNSIEAAKWYETAANLYQAQVENLQQQLSATHDQNHVTSEHLPPLQDFIAEIKRKNPSISGAEVMAAVNAYQQALAAENLQLQNEAMRRQLNSSER